MIALCPHCDNEFYVPVELGGTNVKCSKCKKQVQAPEAPDVSEVAVGPVSFQGSVSLNVSGTGHVAGDQSKTTGGAGLRRSVIPSGGQPRLGLSLPTMPKKTSSSGPTQALKDSLKKKKQLNIYGGLNRLVFVLSLAALMLGLPEMIFYLIDRSVWRIKDIVGFFVPLPAVAFVSVWAVYGGCFCIVRGFCEELRGSRSIGLKRLAFVVSLLPLFPGVSFAIRDLATKPHLKMKEAFGYFIYWPLTAFVGVWIVYFAALFVIRGFYDVSKSKKHKSRKDRLIRPLETKNFRAGGWRTT
jgi:hypothetical protein